MAMNNEAEALGERKTAPASSLKNRKPAYIAAAVILIGLLVIYLLNVYHNQHENNSSLPPKTMTKPVHQ